MQDLWEEEQEVREAEQEREKTSLKAWEEDIVRMSHTEPWLSLRKYLLFKEKQLLSKLYAENLSGQSEAVAKLLGKAGAYREVLELPLRLEEKRV